MTIGFWFENKKPDLEAITRKHDKPGQRTGEKYGYPTTRVYLRQIRVRLMTYFEKDGYRDLVVIKLNPGSYVPVIAYNPVVRGGVDLEPTVANLILRAKTALDARTLRGALRAVKYCSQIPINWENPQQAAGMLFISWAAAPIVPGLIAKDIPFSEMAVSRIKMSGIQPWEIVFVEGCVEACYRHEWQRALDLVNLAVANSLGEAKYYWS